MITMDFSHWSNDLRSFRFPWFGGRWSRNRPDKLEERIDIQRCSRCTMGGEGTMYNIIKVENLTAVIIEIVDGEKRGERKLALLFIFFFFSCSLLVLTY